MLTREDKRSFAGAAQLMGEDTNEWAQLMQVQLIRSFLKGGEIRGW